MVDHTGLMYFFLGLGSRARKRWTGTCHEATGGVHKHIAKSAQRRASIARSQSHEDGFLATFCKGVAGRPPSEKAPSFMSKLIHEHLATEPRIQMWGGATRGEWACGCGKKMTWSDRQDVGPLQWHMLEWTMSEEQSTRKAWRAAIKRAVSAFTTDLPIVESAAACYTDKTDGTIHTACGDVGTSWRPHMWRCTGDAGTWEFDRSSVPPSFDED